MKINCKYKYYISRGCFFYFIDKVVYVSITILILKITRERKQKKNPIFIFKSVRVLLRESVRLRECVNTEFDWEVKQGFEKASVSRAVRLRECPLAES